MRSALRFVIPSLFIIILMTAMTAVAAANTVPATRVEDHPIALQINHLRPAACSGLSLTSLVTGTGTITGTSGNDLILGGTGVDAIDGLSGNDCILGGGGDDIFIGGNGTDVCLGGAGADSFSDCETESQ